MKPLDTLAALGAFTRRLLADWGHGARLLAKLLVLSPVALRRFGLVRDQVHFLGNHSLAIITVSGLFVGFVLGLQGYYTLQRYGSAEALGLLVALSLVRELGPVVAALLFAGRAGASLTAEIGLMRAGEQLTALEMMAVDPLRRILAPRFVGGVIALPLLTAVFSAVGILGGYAVGVLLIGVDAGAFWSQMQSGVDVLKDVGNGMVKSLVFGVAVTFIALYQGYQSAPTPEGVARATTRTVVMGSLMVVVARFATADFPDWRVLSRLVIAGLPFTLIPTAQYRYFIFFQVVLFFLAFHRPAAAPAARAGVGPTDLRRPC